MGKKITVLSILCGILVVVGFRLWIDTPPTYASNKKVAVNATYNEPSASNDYINKSSGSLNKIMPYYMNDGGSPGRNCTTYIKVENILDNKEADVVQEDDRQQKQAEQQASHKRIALTFDDGPHKNVTDQILTTLQKYDVKATFFVLGQNAAKYPDVVKKADAFGHEIANHTWSHKNLTKLNTQQMRAEIDRANEAICDATGKTPTMYRPPFGAMDEKVRESIDLTPVLWNVDTLDWQHKTPKKTLANLKAQAKDNGIILMHDIHQQSADALEDVILYLKEEGYEFVTTSQLL